MPNAIGSNFKIVLDAQSLGISKSGSVTGVIYLSIGDIYFPEHEWSDFPVAILQWWFDAIQALRLKSATSAACLFMDGPLFFTVEDKEGHVEVECFSRKRKTSLAACNSTIDLVRGEVMSAIGVLTKECSDRSWDTAEIRKLAALLAHNQE